MPIQKSVRPATVGVGLKSMPKVNIPVPGLRPGANMQRAQARVARREALRQVVNQVHPLRPAATPRPAGVPVRVMPLVPAPAVSKGMVKAAPFAATGMVVGAAGAFNAGAVHADLSAEVNALQNSVNDLNQRCLFGDLQSELANLDQLVKRVVELLESARQKGYVYQGELDGEVYSLMDQWQVSQPQVAQNITLQANAMQNRLAPLNGQFQQIVSMLSNPTAAAPLLRNVQSQVNTLSAEVMRSEGELRGSYAEVDRHARQINGKLTNIHWAIETLGQAKFQLAEAENLVMAVAARWDKEGKEDPEGILYLTNRRLIFERKEKVATKKILFITTASELVHEVIIDSALANITGCQPENRGMFGHQDYLILQLRAQAGSAPAGSLALHINGQEAKNWAELVTQAISGQIESSRTQGAGGVTLADLTRPLTNADLLALQSELNDLQDEVMLKTVYQELAELQNSLSGLERQLAAVRAGGYQVEKNLEADIAILAVQWERIKANTEATIEYQFRQMSEQMQGLQEELAKLLGMSANLSAARPAYIQLKSALASTEAQADAAEATVLAQYDDYADEVETLMAHLEWIEWMLQAVATAAFRLHATESGVAAVEALLMNPNSPAENGVLFLTDQRILWEDRVGVYEIKVNTPLQDILEVKKELDSQNEILVIYAKGAATLPEMRFRLAQPVGDEWLKMIGRARSGGYALDKAITLSVDELERIRNAPQNCAKCGALFTTPLLRGQSELQCEYCGLTTQI